MHFAPCAKLISVRGRTAVGFRMGEHGDLTMASSALSDNTEVIESQRARSDLLKWKIIVVAALAGTGLGFVKSEGSGQRYADLVLCAIPVVAVYIDLLSRHLSLRILVIGAYRRKAAVRDDYEVFADIARGRSAFQLEDSAVLLSSLLFSMALVLTAPPLGLEPELPHGWAVAGAGAAGILLTLGSEFAYRKLRRSVDAIEWPSSEGEASPTKPRVPPGP